MKTVKIQTRVKFGIRLHLFRDKNKVGCNELGTKFWECELGVGGLRSTKIWLRNAYASGKIM